MDQNACRRELEIEIPVDAVQRKVESVAKEFARLARVPGFRPGKAPVTLIRRRYAEDIKTEVVQSLVPEYFENAVREANLKPLGRPEIEGLVFEEDKPLKFKASFEVLPEIKLGDYKGLEVEEPVMATSEEDVEKALAQLREQAATFVAVEDRPLQDGDYAVLSLTGTQVKPEVKREPIRADDVLCLIGGENTLREFTENLRGGKPGEERRFEVSYSEEYSDRELVGKTIAYTARVRGIKQKQLPELNDEFTKDLGEFSTLDALRAKIRKDLEIEQDHRRREAIRDRLVSLLVERHDFPVPEALVEHQMNSRLERSVRTLVAQGVDPRRLDVDWAKLRRQQREAAVREVKAGLLLEKIADAENIEVSEAEVEREIAAIATRAGQSTEAVRSRLTREGGLDRMNSRLRSEKTVDFIYSNARVVAGSKK